MAAMPICRDCFSGTLRGDAAPTGREEALHGLPTYVAVPGPGVEPLGAVVIIPDAFGWKLRNTRALADAYARRIPATVYVPDFMDGHAPPESTMVLLESKPAAADSWIVRRLKRAWSILRVAPSMVSFVYNCRASLVKPRMLPFLSGVRAGAGGAPGLQKLGVAGFCWGGLYATMLTHDVAKNRVTAGGREHPLVDCAFTAHPSLLSLPAHIAGVAQPLSVANGDDDEWMGRAKMQQVVALLEAKNAQAARDVHEVVIYPGAKHGFAVRGDRDDPQQRERGDQSEDQAVSWFQRHFEAAEPGVGSA
ncbi:hypothetical protein B0T24DRAFT_3139 [Lasiosphaeria ovina]|uniref:Dienelactone hydrolase domain-containing protein n=1 Tax=Lasiosphaeria ovina TaxID=92902 RepID=A0AAE0NIJ3_9PEZI|nr:hypothetical protein B0T24DRAFT_3139 [Lasiosphaeria ovina]